MKVPTRIAKIAQLTGHNASIFTITADLKPGYFLSGAGDGWVVRWNFEDPDPGKLIAKVDTQIFSMCPVPNTDYIVVGNMNGGVHWVNVEQPEQTKNIAHHKFGVFDIQLVFPHIYTLGGAGMLSRWSIEERRAVESVKLSVSSLRCMHYSKARNELAIGASDHCIYLLDADSLKIKHKIAAAHDNSVFAVKYSPDDQFLLSGGRDAHLKVRAIEQDFKLIFAQPAHWYTINSISFSPNGTFFATGSRDKTLKIWDAKEFSLLKVLEGVRDSGHLNSVNKVFWSNHKNYLLSASDDRSIIIWQVE